MHMAVPDAVTEFFQDTSLLHVMSALNKQVDGKTILKTYYHNFQSIDITPVYLPMKHPYKFRHDPDLPDPDTCRT